MNRKINWFCTNKSVSLRFVPDGMAVTMLPAHLWLQTMWPVCSSWAPSQQLKWRCSSFQESGCTRHGWSQWAGSPPPPPLHPWRRTPDCRHRPWPEVSASSAWGRSLSTPFLWNLWEDRYLKQESVKNPWWYIFLTSADMVVCVFMKGCEEGPFGQLLFPHQLLHL